MNYRFTTDLRNNLLFLVFITALFAALIILPFQYRSEAGVKNINQSANQPEYNKTGLENYDIRLDKSDRAADALLKFRQEEGKTAFAIADTKDYFVRGEMLLRKKIPTLKVEYNSDLRIPEVISPDIKKSKAFLSVPSNLKRPEILRNFIKANVSLMGFNNHQADQLTVTADYTNPSGNMSFAHLEQRINDIPVFRGEIKAGFTTDGKIIRVINNLAPGIDYSLVSTEFYNGVDAVKAAAGHINYQLKPEDIIQNEAASNDSRMVFGEGDWATTAEKIYFPTEVGVVRPAWRVLIWQPVDAYYVIVDAETGTLFWRKNITEDQTQGATYQVYRNANAFIDVIQSPAPLKPGPVSPFFGTQGTLINRTNLTLIGNEGDLSFNNKGWITDGGTSTIGNNVGAGLDLMPPDGLDSVVTRANRVFDSAWNPPPGNPAPGDAPSVQAARDGAVIQMFYLTNRYHDILYKFGFTESAFNFQIDNFGRGGVGNDGISAQGQDFASTDGGNFATPADGISGRMQMFIFTAPEPDRDPSGDADVVLHELTHGTSNRLHGNAAGLTTTMARGMGEGWSDWYAHMLVSEPSDPINGIYPSGGYVLSSPGNTASYYYGVRRFPKAVMAFTGGPNNRPHNPLTFIDIDVAECDTSDGAFPAQFTPVACDQQHAAGEIWSSALWEIRALMIQRLGFQTGTERVLQIVTDGMKLAPLNPTFLQERDAIIAAARANGNSPDTTADIADVWEGFRIRGMGFSATVEQVSPALVTEAFDSPNLTVAETGFAVSDSTGDNDGFPEPGEPVLLSIPIFNNTGFQINNVTVNIDGGTNVGYGNIADGATVTNQIPYLIPLNAVCGNLVTVTININSSGGARTETKNFVIGQPTVTHTENFDGVTAPALPSGWSSTQTGNGVAFVTKTGTADTEPNSVFTPNTGQPGPQNGAILESPGYTINTEAGILSFRNNYNTESGWDGGVLEISISGGAFQDIITAGGRFIEGGYNGALGINQNPLDGRSAWTGNSGGYLTTKVKLPSSASGQTVKFRWRFGEDSNTSVVGWNVDTVEVFAQYVCSFTNPTNGTNFDYDGDGKSDISVFRSSTGVWYLNQSTNGFFAVSFGLSNDLLAPADYDGDGKTDIAVFREGIWYWLNSSNFSFNAVQFGISSDIPVPADYTGDGRAELAVYRNGVWWMLEPANGQVKVIQFGISSDKPVPADFDGDGKTDQAVYRDGTWFWLRSSDGGFNGMQFGVASDRPTVGDYDGDSRADQAVYRDGIWYILASTRGFYAFQFGLSSDLPVPADYDGDGKTDAAVYRDGIWYLLQSQQGFATAQFGLSDDKPTPAAFLP